VKFAIIWCRTSKWILISVLIWALLHLFTSHNHFCHIVVVHFCIPIVVIDIRNLLDSWMWISFNSWLTHYLPLKNLLRNTADLRSHFLGGGGGNEFLRGRWDLGTRFVGFGWWWTMIHWSFTQALELHIEVGNGISEFGDLIFLVKIWICGLFDLWPARIYNMLSWDHLMMSSRLFMRALFGIERSTIGTGRRNITTVAKNEIMILWNWWTLIFDLFYMW
jgi:hypothetical protein